MVPKESNEENEDVEQESEKYFPPPLYTPGEVAEIFKVDPKTVTRWARNGKFESNGVQVLLTMGNHRRFYRHEIHALLERLNPGYIKSMEGNESPGKDE